MSYVSLLYQLWFFRILIVTIKIQGIATHLRANMTKGNNTKRGRPRKPDHLKSKPRTKVMRVPVEAMRSFRLLMDAYESGHITTQDIEKVAGRAKNKSAHNSGGLVIKYRHPEDDGLVWAGRGRYPSWLKDEIESGACLEDFRIGDINHDES